MTSEEFDATAAAARAVGEQAEGTLSADDGVDGGAANHAAAEGADSGGSHGLGSTSAWREMLLSTGPDVSLEDVENPWDPDNGGPPRIYRGLRKMTGLDGMPAIIDICIGCVEFAHQLSGRLPDDEEADVEAGAGDDVQEDRDAGDGASEIEGVPSA